MLPSIAIVGRPNVGKSTLFNSLTRRKNALVINKPGVTRDRIFGLGEKGRLPYILIDTGGIGEIDNTGIDAVMYKQVKQAILEVEHIIFVTDAKLGISAADLEIAEFLRKNNCQVTVAVNKTDGTNEVLSISDFYNLGFTNVLPISASNNKGVITLIETVLTEIEKEHNISAELPNKEHRLKLAIVGKPNVGKSTLVNRILGEERVVVFDLPGTTVDSVYIDFERDGTKYTIIDTAGMRKRKNISEQLEKFSVIKSLQAIKEANVVLVVIDAQIGLQAQDLSILSFVEEAGKALIIAFNKWDNLAEEQKKQLKSEIKQKLDFVDFAVFHNISALHGTNVGLLLGSVNKVYANATKELSSSNLTNALALAVAEHQPPLIKGRRIKLRYAHAGGHNPPIIVIHGNQLEQLPLTYKRYLSKFFREHFNLTGTPIKLTFKTGDNPFAEVRNKLTSRQVNKKRRNKKHLKQKYAKKD